MYRCSCSRDRGVRIFIIALIIIGALGYFVYTKYVHDHISDGDWVVVEEATCTESGLRAKYCKICKQQSETEVIPAAHTPASPVEEKLANPTHTEEGAYNSVVYCSECNTKISSETCAIVPTGHRYEWELKYNESTASFYAEGTCSCGESGSSITVNEDDEENKISVVPSNGNLCACGATEYTASVTVDGKTAKCSIKFDAPLEEHMVEFRDADGVFHNVPLSDYAEYDQFGVYYVPTEGVYIIRYTDTNDPEGNEWDNNGFALGIFWCTTCENPIRVRIYSPEHDTRLQNP